MPLSWCRLIRVADFEAMKSLRKALHLTVGLEHPRAYRIDEPGLRCASLGSDSSQGRRPDDKPVLDLLNSIHFVDENMQSSALLCGGDEAVQLDDAILYGHVEKTAVQPVLLANFCQ